METSFIQAVDIKNALIHRMCYSFLRLSNCWRRHPTAKLNFVVVIACFVYFVFALHQVGQYVNSQDHRPDQSQRYRTGRGVYSVLIDDPLTVPEPPAGQNPTVSSESHPTRSNIVYITLRSKRLKPAIIRGTVRPKARRKNGKKAKYWDSNALQSTIGKVGDTGDMSDHRGGLEWSQIGLEDFNSKIIKQLNAVDLVSSIRIYSGKAPPWLTKQDVDAMRFLAGSPITRISKLHSAESPNALLLESAADGPPRRNSSDHDPECQGRCGVIKRTVDMCEVFAFHLDRVLNLNMSLPAVGRRFQFLEGIISYVYQKQ